MTLHHPTVPVEVACRKALDHEAEPIAPVVLVVDDEPLIAETLVAILKAAGFAAIAATDAREALEIAQVIPPQMLITDVPMSGTNGFDLAIEVMRLAPDCEVILCSGQPETYDLAKEYRAQGYDFVTLIKPVHPANLVAHVFDRLGAFDPPIPVDGLARPEICQDFLGGPPPFHAKPRAHRGRKPRTNGAQGSVTAPAMSPAISPIQ